MKGLFGKMKVKMILLMATVLTFIASVGAASACTAIHYQPKLPEILAKNYE